MIEQQIVERFLQLENEIPSVRKTRTADNFSVYFDDVVLQKWSIRVLNLLQRVFGDGSVHYQNFVKAYDKYPSLSFSFDSCAGIFLGAKDDYENGYLFNVRSLVKAEVLSDDVFAQARELLAHGYKDPACILIGVALEVAIKEICAQRSIPFAKLDKMNADLCKAGLYNMAKQKQITAWADLRNRAAHGEWTQYSNADVSDFLIGVERFVAEYL